MQVLGIQRFGLTRSSRAIKRTLDLAVAGFGLFAIAPLLAVIALVIKLDSPGPALFRQRRTGRRQIAFTILKFRTMIAASAPTRSRPTPGAHPQRGRRAVQDA